MTFRFLRGAAGEQSLLDAHRPTIHRILRNDFTKKNMEKLTGHDVYSFRLGDAERLLLSIILVNQKKYLLVLEYLPTHDYDKSRFLKSGVLAQYKEKMGTSDKLQFEEIENLDAFGELEFHEDANGIAVDFYQDKWITLDTTQNDILHLKLPAVVNGTAGSGKSCVALSLLSAEVQQRQHDEDTPKRFLYVSQNPALVQKMKEAWLKLPVAVIHEDEAAAHAPVVEFKTFNDLLPPTIKIADEHVFSSWFKIKIQEKTKRKEKDSIFLSLDEAKLYEEFRICSGYSAEGYQGLGARQSLIDDDNHNDNVKRREILFAFAAYKDHLSSLGLVDPSLDSFPFESTYSLVIVDETQDFSNAQIINLAKLTNNKQIICFMDSHQRLNDRLSIRPFLLKFFDIPKESPSHAQLISSYRCPQRIMTVANEVIHLKHNLVQGIADKYEAKSITSQLLDSLGAIHLVDEESLFRASWTKEQSTEFAIITSETNKARAIELFQTPLVFTPSEIKGLEYPIILAWELFDEAFFKRAFKRWVEVKDRKAVTGRSSEGKDEGFISPLNAIFTAYTRAEQRLLICEKTTRENNILLELLRPHHEDLPLTLKQVETTRAQWEEELRRQIRQGNDEQAHRIFTMRLGELAKDYPKYTADLIASTKTKHEAAAATPLAATRETAARPAAAAAKPVARVTRPETAAIAHPTRQTKDKLFTCAELAKKDFNTKGLEFLQSDNDTDLPFILLKKYFKDETCPEGYSLIEWILKDESRTQILIRGLLHHVKLFVKLFLLNLSSLAPKENEKFRAFLKFQEKFYETHKKSLLKSPASSILHHIVEHSKNTKIDIRHYVELGGDLNLSVNNFTAALLAVQNKRLDVLKVLHELGMNFNLVTSIEHITPVYLAAQKGNIEAIKQLHQMGANLDIPYSSCLLTPAFIAAQQGDIDVIRMLHSLNANLNHKAIDGRTIAHIAAQYNQVAMIELLHSLGFDLNQKNDAGYTPLHNAIIQGNIEMIKKLRSLPNVDFNIITKGNTPAHIAVEFGNIKCLEELQAGGANLGLCNKDGFTPIGLATLKNNFNMIHKLHQLGVNINCVENNAKSPIHIATEMGNIDLVHRLHQLGANINLPAQDGTTPIHLAAAKNNIHMIEELHKLGANLNQVTKIGNAAIHIAAANNSIAVIIKLFRLGANLNQTNGIGAIAADIAKDKGHIKALEAIQKFAPSVDSHRFFIPAPPKPTEEQNRPSP